MLFRTRHGDRYSRPSGAARSGGQESRRSWLTTSGGPCRGFSCRVFDFYGIAAAASCSRRFRSTRACSVPIRIRLRCHWSLARRARNESARLPRRARAKKRRPPKSTIARGACARSRDIRSAGTVDLSKPGDQERSCARPRPPESVLPHRERRADDGRHPLRRHRRHLPPLADCRLEAGKSRRARRAMGRT